PTSMIRACVSATSQHRYFHWPAEVPAYMYAFLHSPPVPVPEPAYEPAQVLALHRPHMALQFLAHTLGLVAIKSLDVSQLHVPHQFSFVPAKCSPKSRGIVKENQGLTNVCDIMAQTHTHPHVDVADESECAVE